MDPNTWYEGQTQQYYPFPPNPSPIVPAGVPDPATSEALGAGVAVAPPGVDSQAPNSYAPQVGYEGDASSYSYVYPAGGVAPQYPGYGVAADAQGFVANPVALTNVLGSLPSVSIYQNKKATHPSHIGAIWKKKKKIPKAIQPAYCEVCNLICNSQEVLNSHRQGKKHKKNLEKLTESIVPNPAKALTKLVENKGTPEAEKDKTGGEKSKKKVAPATEVDLETKRRKVLEGGAAATAVKVCTLCNVVCNSDVVFRFHISGQKHAAMVKNQQAAPVT